MAACVAEGAEGLEVVNIVLAALALRRATGAAAIAVALAGQGALLRPCRAVVVGVEAPPTFDAQAGDGSFIQAEPVGRRQHRLRRQVHLAPAQRLARPEANLAVACSLLGNLHIPMPNLAATDRPFRRHPHHLDLAAAQRVGVVVHLNRLDPGAARFPVQARDLVRGRVVQVNCPWIDQARRAGPINFPNGPDSG